MEQVVSNLIYCLNATVPVFLMMLLGVFFRRIGFFDEKLAGKLNAFVFKVGLPVMLFKDLAGSDFFAVWDGTFVLFCFLATVCSILITAAAGLLLRERPLRGEFIQAGYRSSVALLGVAFLENLYGSSGAASLVIIGAVPLYNVAAVAALTFTSPGQGGLDQAALKMALKGIVWALSSAWSGPCSGSPSPPFCKRPWAVSRPPPRRWGSWHWELPLI